MKKNIYLCILFILFSSSANAAYLSGFKLKQFADQYDSPNATFSSGTFIGYVMGVADTLNYIGFCIPSDVTAGQISAMVAKYLRENPEAWNQPADILVHNAIVKTFPCPSRNKKPPHHSPSRTF